MSFTTNWLGQNKRGHVVLGGVVARAGRYSCATEFAVAFWAVSSEPGGWIQSPGEIEETYGGSCVFDTFYRLCSLRVRKVQ